MNKITGLKQGENRPLRVENGKREKWRETHDLVIILPFTFAVKVMHNLSNVCEMVSS